MINFIKLSTANVCFLECGAEECSEGCTKGNGCDCSPKDEDFSTYKTFLSLFYRYLETTVLNTSLFLMFLAIARFDTRLQVVDQPNINISQEIIKQASVYDIFIDL